MRPLLRLPWLALGALALGCGEKEAEDPHDLLAEEYERAGAEEPDSPQSPPELAPASRSECEAATRRLIEIAGTAGEPGENELIAERVEECLARETSRREARCVAKARDEAAVERCAE